MVFGDGSEKRENTHIYIYKPKHYLCCASIATINQQAATGGNLRRCRRDAAGTEATKVLNTCNPQSPLGFQNGWSTLCYFLIFLIIAYNKCRLLFRPIIHNFYLGLLCIDSRSVGVGNDPLRPFLMSWTPAVCFLLMGCKNHFMQPKFQKPHFLHADVRRLPIWWTYFSWVVESSWIDTYHKHNAGWWSLILNTA